MVHIKYTYSILYALTKLGPGFLGTSTLAFLSYLVSVQLSLGAREDCS